MRMNKTDLGHVVAERNGLTRKQGEDVVESMMNILMEELAKGNEITLAGFGAFSARLRKARGGVHPRRPTERIQVPDRMVPKFKAGRVLKDRLNPGRTEPIERTQSHASPESASL